MFYNYAIHLSTEIIVVNELRGTKRGGGGYSYARVPQATNYENNTKCA